MSEVDSEINSSKEVCSDESEEKCEGEIAGAAKFHKVTSLDSGINIPDCWTLDQKEDFCHKNEWLIVKIKNWGAKVARKLEN